MRVQAVGMVISRPMQLPMLVRAVMAATDTCSRRFGCRAVAPGAAGLALARTWSTKFEMRSPQHTTRLSELPVIAAARGEMLALGRPAALRNRDIVCPILDL